MIHKEPGAIRRYEHNPILSPKDIPYPCDLVYNPAACKAGDEYILIIRIAAFEGLDKEIECLGLARSKDGYHFTVDPEPILFPDEDDHGRLNDPRITYIDGWYYLTYCSDPGDEAGKFEGIFLCIARTKDFHGWERVYRSEPDNRNAVIFPERIGGLYVRLDRPFRRGYKRENSYDIWISYSPDMEFWGRHRLILSSCEIPWGSHKIGPAAPPVRTRKGWLVLFHGAEIAEPGSRFLPWMQDGKPNPVTKVYRPGVMLLDLENPSKVIGICKQPLMEISAAYEMDPYFRPNVIFPCGIIEEPDGELKIYYGASDTHIAVATAKKDDLVDLCLSSV